MNKGTKQGSDEEIELVIKLNSDKTSNLWIDINITNNRNYYAVRCTGKILSKISNKKVLPKTDVFIIESFNKIILDKYYLDENMLIEQNINYTPIVNSGISVKEKDSKSFTYQKMTIETFYKIFGNYELGCAIEYYTKEEDYHKHPMMEKAWKTNKDKIIEKLKKLSIEYNYPNSLLLDTYQNIKQSAIKLTEHIINNNSKISDFIFKGIEAFNSPYYAVFIYKEGRMSLNSIPTKYSISTGSGRSNGKYTVVIKP